MKLTVKDMALCALFAALISIGAVFSIPLPGNVPISIQPFVAMLAGAVIGSRRGAISMFVYMMMGVIGLPVFSNMTRASEAIAKGTFGYIIGFIVCAFVTGKIIEESRKKDSKVGYFIGPVIGILLDYVLGLPFLFIVQSIATDGLLPLQKVLEWGFYPFIGLDILKAALVTIVALSVVPKLEKANLYN